MRLYDKARLQTKWKVQSLPTHAQLWTFQPDGLLRGLKRWRVLISNLLEITQLNLSYRPKYQKINILFNISVVFDTQSTHAPSEINQTKGIKHRLVKTRPLTNHLSFSIPQYVVETAAKVKLQLCLFFKSILSIEANWNRESTPRRSTSPLSPPWPE